MKLLVIAVLIILLLAQTTDKAKTKPAKLDKMKSRNSKDIWRKGGKGVIDMQNITEIKEPVKPVDQPDPNDVQIKPKQHDRPDFIQKEFFKEEVKFKAGESRTFEIDLKFLKDQPVGARDDNVIVVELYGTNGQYMEMKDLVLDSKMYVPGKETEYVTIKPKKMDLVEGTNDQSWYWFVIYDLCQVNANSTV